MIYCKSPHICDMLIVLESVSQVWGLFLKGEHFIMKQLIYNTALYLRLSRDDDNAGESNSIATQRMMLQNFAEQNHLRVVDEYADDGYSGTNFDRPGFQRMIGDIEAGRINCVVTKDLSRLGRNYLMTGQYIEMYFPLHGVRYIAVDNGVDTNNQQSAEFTPFLNVINEWYTRDTSRKVTKALRTRFENGAHYGAYAPLGYRKDPEQVGHLVVDDETKWIIEKIFRLALQGAGAASITHKLVKERIPTPSWLNFQRYGTFAHVYEDKPESRRYEWTTSQVRKILMDEVYIGHSVHNRQAPVSFKCKKRVNKPKDEWWKVENTHEAIISKEDFDRVQQNIASRRRERKNGTTQIFAGLVKCADCGWSLGYCENKQNKTPYGYYHCVKHGQGLGQCSMHYIRYDVLYLFVLSRLQYWIEAIHQDEQAILERLSKSGATGQAAANKRAAQEKKRAEKRLAELDNLLAKVYEDRVSEKINERTFTMLTQKYEQGQNELEARIEVLAAQLASAKEQKDGINKWVDLVKQYSSPTELTAEMLNALIEKILVHEAVKDADGKRTQEIEIVYRFVGKID